jgi:hypothetical protein
MIDSVDLALYGHRSYELMLDYWANAEVNPRSLWTSPSPAR